MTLPTLPQPRTGNRPAFDPKVTAHFHASAALYKLWSREGHLHFGYWRWPIAPWDRKAMLEELTHQVVRPLLPQPGQRLADLGCGYGSSARLVAATHDVHVDAFTVVGEQVREGREAVAFEGLTDHVTLHLRDFRDTGLPDASMDGVYAVESLCYDDDPGKAGVLGEIARVLRPGGRLALTDGFIVRPPTGWRGRMVRTVEQGWAVPLFPRLRRFLQALEAQGFRDITTRDMSLRMGMCALHGLPLLAYTELRRLTRRGHLDPLERAHLKSCLLGIALGTQRDLFKYLLVTATKP